ncbi:MAG: sialidase family protein, partial [candidate division WOR-3 bacterium]
MKKFSGDSAIRNPKSAMPFLATFYSAILCGGLFATFTYAQSGWGPDTRLSYRQGYSYDPKAACNGDTIHLVWWESYAHEEVFYKRSTDAGLTWGEDVMLSVEDGQSSVLPEIAVSGNTVHVIWFEDDFGILYRRSTDGGANWENIDSIIPGMTYSSIHALGDTVFIAGTIGSLGVLRFTKSFDGGNSWRPIIEITRASSSPRIRSINNNSLRLVISYDKGGSPLCAEVYQVLSYD